MRPFLPFPVLQTLCLSNVLQINILCSQLPAEFGNYMTYARGMQFEERPDYVTLRQTFRSVCTEGPELSLQVFAHLASFCLCFSTIIVFCFAATVTCSPAKISSWTMFTTGLGAPWAPHLQRKLWTKSF